MQSDIPSHHQALGMHLDWPGHCTCSALHKSVPFIVAVVTEFAMVGLVVVSSLTTAAVVEL